MARKPSVMTHHGLWYWHKITQPCTLLGPALWFEQSPQARLHQTLITRVKKPYETVLIIWHTVYWYLLLFWLLLAKLLLRSRLLHRTAPIKRSQQLRQLCVLGLWYGIKPRSYYLFKLYQYPRNEWLHFIYPQEQAKWHLAHSTQAQPHETELLHNKHAFAQWAAQHHLQAVPTLLLINKTNTMNQSLAKQLFNQQSYFLKPSNANASRGCFTLRYSTINQGYTLKGKCLNGQTTEINPLTDIKALLGNHFSQKNYLLQALLENSDEIMHFCGTDELATIRVITVRHHSNIKISHALFEVPSKKNTQWHVYAIDTQNGDILPSTHRNNTKQPFTTPLPQWPQIQQLALQAHTLLGSLTTIAWDISIVKGRPVLLEGNTGWNLIPPQTIPLQPLLKNPLLVKAWSHAQSIQR